MRGEALILRHVNDTASEDGEGDYLETHANLKTCSGRNPRPLISMFVAVGPTGCLPPKNLYTVSGWSLTAFAKAFVGPSSESSSDRALMHIASRQAARSTVTFLPYQR